MKQTAMQMAINHYKQLSEKGSNQAYIVAKFLEDNFLDVEKEQIIYAAQWMTPSYADAEQYYNETYGKDEK